MSMISNNDLYDIAFALVAILNNIKYQLNTEVLSQIILVLKKYNERDYQDNQVRKALASIQGLDRERWYYVFHNNVYVDRKLLKTEEIYKLLIRLCEESYVVLKAHNYEKAYDLIDCYHCLPNIIIENHYTIPKIYWKVYIKPYREKWDKSFLILEQKNYTKIFKP